MNISAFSYIFALVLLANLCIAQAVAQNPEFVWRFHTLDGKTVEPMKDEQTKAIVLVFVSTDCPIANAYHPFLKTLGKSYSEKGIRFFLMHSATYITKPDAEKHAKDYKLTFPVVLDSDQSFAKHLQAKVTPEAFVIDAKTKKTVYRGAINNLYADYGKKRAKATKNYLKDAIDSVIAGEKISVGETKAIGCFISYDK